MNIHIPESQEFGTLDVRGLYTPKFWLEDGSRSLRKLGIEALTGGVEVPIHGQERLPEGLLGVPRKVRLLENAGRQVVLQKR